MKLGPEGLNLTQMPS